MASYLSLPGSSGNDASTPASSEVNVTGDIDIQIRLALPSYAPGADLFLVSTWVWISGNGYVFFLESGGGGILQFTWEEAGNAQRYVQSSESLGLEADSIQWLRVTLDVDDGAGGHVVTFYKGGIGAVPSWSQFGDTGNAGAFTTDIKNGGVDLRISHNNKPVEGNIYRCLIYGDLAETDLRFDADFTAQAPGTTSFEEGANAATVTINQSGSPQAEIIEDPANPWIDALVSSVKLGHGLTI